MAFLAPPPSAAWIHQGARSGFEVAFFARTGGGYLLTGCSTAVEDGQPWIVEYEIRVDSSWITRGARVTGRSTAGLLTLQIEADGNGGWQVDGVAVPYLDGCLDLDLESSAMTNALPVHRLALEVGARAAAPAAYVRAVDFRVERLEQDYARIADEGGRQRYDYASPAFGCACQLTYDEAGLVLDYPGIAVRAAER